MAEDLGKDYWVTVCDRCFMAVCWHGVFSCQESQFAGTTRKRASELRQLNLEHPGNYSRSELLKVCGQVDEVNAEHEQGR